MLPHGLIHYSDVTERVSPHDYFVLNLLHPRNFAKNENANVGATGGRPYKQILYENQ